MILAKGGRVAPLFYSNFNTANYILLIQTVISVLSHEYDIHRMTVSNWYVPSSIFSGVAKLMKCVGPDHSFLYSGNGSWVHPCREYFYGWYIQGTEQGESYSSVAYIKSRQLWKITGSRIRNRIQVFIVAAQTHTLADFTTNVKHNKGVSFCCY